MVARKNTSTYIMVNIELAVHGKVEYIALIECAIDCFRHEEQPHHGETNKNPLSIF